MKKERKKETQTGNFPWQKVLIIAVGVVFAVMFVFQYAMTSGMLQYLRGVRANDTVTLDFTLKDEMGQPILTTDQSLYTAASQQRVWVFLTSPLTLRAGYIGNPAFMGVNSENLIASRLGNPTVRFGLLGQELDQLDVGVIGMKAGDTKTIRFNFTDPLTVTMKNYEFNAMGMNFTTIAVGDPVPLGFSETPMAQGLEGANSTPTNAVLRIATVTNKTADSIELFYGYPSADITVREFK